MKRLTSNTYMYPVAPPFDVAYRNESVSYPVGPHTHNAAEIYYTMTDLPDVLLNDTVSAVPAGTLLIIPAFCIHQLYHETGKKYERYILSINSEWIKAIFSDNSAEYSYLYDSQEPVLLFPDKAQKKELIRRLNGLLSLPEKSSPMSLISFLQLFEIIHSSVLSTTISFHSDLPVSSAQKRVNEIISFLQEHIQENITITDLSDHFHLNPDYLARLFKSHMHISLGKYIILLKISAAETMLREGKSVTEVQETLAYSSYAHFFKTFQRITGISPSKYRRQSDPA